MSGSGRLNGGSPTQAGRASVGQQDEEDARGWLPRAKSGRRGRVSSPYIQHVRSTRDVDSSSKTEVLKAIFAMQALMNRKGPEPRTCPHCTLYHRLRQPNVSRRNLGSPSCGVSSYQRLVSAITHDFEQDDLPPMPVGCTSTHTKPIVVQEIVIGKDEEG